MKCRFTRVSAMLTALCLMMLPGCPALGAGVTVTDSGLDMAGGSVRFPVLAGDAPAESLAAWNAAIARAGDTDYALGQMLQRGEGMTPVRETFRWSESALAGDLFSCAFELTGLRPAHQWRSLVLDLRTGEALAPEDLFADRNAGMEGLAELLRTEVQPALSPMLAHRQLLPVPERFTADASGVTLYYDTQQLQTLRDRAGTVRIRWSELKPWLRTDADSVYVRAGGRQAAEPESRAAVEAAVAGGALPGIPAKLGDSIPALLEAFGLAEDPDLYSGGRMFAPEDGAFRSSWLLSDALTAGWDDSRVQGLRSDCADLAGLCTGSTTVEAWRQLLGAPDSTLRVDEERAEAIRSVPGTSDYYWIGGHNLRLHADEAGVLVSIWLLE